jgi:DNA-binding CsgD family transcriptional regulator
VSDPVNFLWAAMAEARAAHARSDPEAVVRALESLGGSSRDNVVEPGIQPWRALLAEALVQLGRLDEAEAVLAELEACARAFERRSALVAAARVRGQLEHSRSRRDAADEAFELGAELATGLPHEFEHGLFDLTRGRYLRRTRRRGAAAAALQAARRRFSALRAFPYLELCDAEMAATGLGEGRVVTTSSLGLTPQELAIAHLVAAGLTNREIAAELFLSVKTVEYHLGKTFTKLGVSTRTQLARRMTGADPACD